MTAKRKTTARKKRAAPKAKLVTKPRAKAAAIRPKQPKRPKRSAPERAVAAPADSAPTTEAIAYESVAASSVDLEPSPDVKKGAVARLAGGVGSLFARMTKKKAPDPDQTVELVSGDIMWEGPAPPPIPAAKVKKSKV